MRTAVARAGIALCAFWIGAATAAEQGTVYRWVDQSGTQHYTDRPPEGAPAEELSLRYRLTDPAAIQAAAQAKAELEATRSVREGHEAQAAAAAAAERAALKRQRDANCKQAKDRLEKYNTVHRLYKPGADGERQYLTDDETDKARVEARRSVDEWCSQ
jgi:hypothetical protein